MIKLMPMYVALKNAQHEIERNLQPEVTMNLPARVVTKMQIVHGQVLDAQDEILQIESLLEQKVPTLP